MQIKTTMSSQLTPYNQKNDYNKKKERDNNPLYTACGNVKSIATLENSLQGLQNTKHKPSNPTYRYILKTNENICSSKTSTQMFVAALPIIDKK